MPVTLRPCPSPSSHIRHPHAFATGALHPGPSEHSIPVLDPERSPWDLEFLVLGVVFSPWKTVVPRGVRMEKGIEKASRHLHPTLLNGEGGVPWDGGQDSLQGLELSLAAQNTSQVFQANLANSW